MRLGDMAVSHKNSKTVSFQTIHQCSSSVFYSSWLVSLHFALLVYVPALNLFAATALSALPALLPLWFEI